MMENCVPAALGNLCLACRDFWEISREARVQLVPQRSSHGKDLARRFPRATAVSVRNQANLNAVALVYLADLADSLRVVQLSGCNNLGQDCLEVLKQLLKLEDLIIEAGDKLAEVPEAVWKLTGLTKLAVRACPQLTVEPDDIGLLTGLQELDLSGNPNVVQLPEAISKLLGLRSLNLNR